MTQREIQAKSRLDMLEEYPIEGKLLNWYFRIRETSMSAWLVEGSDIWRRKVSRTGRDPDALLSMCVEEAAEIARQSTS